MFHRLFREQCLEVLIMRQSRPMSMLMTEGAMPSAAADLPRA
jgi:hypothetical protein